MPHIHRMRPLWLLLCSPAWNDGYQKIITHARCSLCGHEATLAAWQSPRHLHDRVVAEDDA